uniref:Peptidase C1A papain C-terminal domain-containing protein n=1 Tax=Ditylenchus dipsaci TaxID=166011 RepID=A0A915E3U1_9BILA
MPLIAQLMCSVFCSKFTCLASISRLKQVCKSADLLWRMCFILLRVINFRYAHRKGGGKAAIPTVVHYLRPFTGFWQETCLPFHDDGILFKIGIARSSTIGHFLQLLKKRPVAVTISVTRRFRDYTTTAWSEFYKVSARDRDLIIGNHALVLLCYRSDPEGNVDVLAQSSWGPDYGILGYVWIRLDSNAEKYMSLTSDVVYITDVERDN